jgi:hypothetical protein
MSRNKCLSYFPVRISDCLVGVFILLLFFSPLDVFSGTTGDWGKVIDKNGIVVYTRETGNSLIKEQKTLSTFQTSMDKLVSLIRDIKNRENWFKRLSSVEILKEYSPDHFIFRMILDMPYPLTDKEVIQELQIIPDSLHKKTRIKFNSRPEFLPPDDNYIRVLQSYGHYELKETAQGTVFLQLISFNDPGKGFPPALYNLFVAQAPYRLIRHFHEEINKMNAQENAGRDK